jgi:peptidoglycan/LPS O-acetylase OafA/YrhL
MTRIKWFNAVRAFGLFLVLGYHLFYEWMPGGFLGVDIFFTFSGFLITALIMEEVRKNKTFALFKFYKRRFQRIWIPLFLTVLFTLPFMLFISPDFTVDIAHQSASALSFTTNWAEIRAGGSYEARLLPSMYIHTWSLAVEMQFYLAWGFVCALLAAVSNLLFGGDDKKQFKCFKTLTLLFSGFIAVCSFLYMENTYNAGGNIDAIYFNTFARFFPFFIGAFAAVIWGVQDKQDVFLKSHVFAKHKVLMTLLCIFAALAAAAIILINFSQHKYGEAFIYHYGFLFTALLTVVLIYSTHGLHIVTPSAVEEPKPLKAAADMSYDVYLFHWPFYVIFTALILNNMAASLVTLLFSFGFSALAFYGAERLLIPQSHKKGFKNTRMAVGIFTACAVIAGSMGALVIYRAPAINSIEADFASSYVMQDMARINALKRDLEAINTEPVVYRALTADYLPEPAVTTPVPTDTPAPTATPVPTTTPEPSVSTPEPTPAPAPEIADAPEPPPNPVAVSLNISGGVTVIGDSVALGAQTALVDTIPDCYVDAVVSRPVSAGLGIINELQDHGELREYLVIALGTNGTNNYAKLITGMIEAVAPGHRIIVVTPFDGRSNENAQVLTETAKWMRDLPSQYDYVTIADWNALISPQVNLLAKDKVHMGGQTSMALYANNVAEAVDRASQKPAKP